MNQTNILTTALCQRCGEKIELRLPLEAVDAAMKESGWDTVRGIWTCPACLLTRRWSPPRCGGLKIGDEVEVEGDKKQGTVVNFVPNTEKVVVDHGLYTRVYHWMRLNYPM